MKISTLIKPLLPLAVLIITVIGLSMSTAAEQGVSQTIASQSETTHPTLGSSLHDEQRGQNPCHLRKMHKDIVKDQKALDEEPIVSEIHYECPKYDDADDPLITYKIYRNKYDDYLKEISKIYGLTPNYSIQSVSKDSPQYDVIRFFYKISIVYDMLDTLCVKNGVYGDFSHFARDMPIDPTILFENEDFKKLKKKVINNLKMADKRDRISEIIFKSVLHTSIMKSCCPRIHWVNPINEGQIAGDRLESEDLISNIKDDDYALKDDKNDKREPQYTNTFCQMCIDLCKDDCKPHKTNATQKDAACEAKSKIEEKREVSEDCSREESCDIGPEECDKDTMCGSKEKVIEN